MYRSKFSYKYQEPKITIDYLKDNRDWGTYEEYLKAGWENEQILVMALKEIWEKQGYEVTFNFLANDYIAYTMDQVEAYTPDVEMTFKKSGKTSRRKYEIKTTDKEPKEWLDVKAFQIDTLHKEFPGTHLLFSTPTRYVSIPVEEFITKGQIVKSDFIGGKVCYRIWIPSLIDMWNYFEQPLEFVPYPKMPPKK